MRPIQFPGSVEIGKPTTMTDEQCSSAWAVIHKDAEGNPEGFTTCWMPSYEDLKSLAAGGGIFIHFPYPQLPAMAMFTLDEKGECNDAG